MKETIWTQTYNVNTFLVNPQKKLGLYGLLNLLQDTAWIHATHLGHGYEAMIQEQTAWVLTRQKLSMNRWPKWGDDIELRTWVRPINGIFAVRDFEILDQGEKFGECTTQWLILDLKTRKPAAVGLQDQGQFRMDAPPFLEAGKIHLKNDLKEMAQFQVRNSDLDLNGHVNNTRYAQWILDSISEAKHRQYTLKEYEVNFIAETMSNDTIVIYGGALSEDKFQFQGFRTQDQKVVFSATLKVAEN
ncbi:acyl-[acyl-carrier-protein] thioesterase [Peredibacter starrii]|uniref:Thioesterase n=1 Tax=Peredibacter starrii TaxID=28202 RepID=A0AAX4HLH8_9BACT|nr:acyl-ACP thioesterase domain-containing protein [Peredibacter starrii]WPU64123.1 thioesterase [Peredibacter starrii]